MEGVVISSPAEMQRLLKPYAGQELASESLTDWLAVPAGVGGFRELPHPSRILNERSTADLSAGGVRPWMSWWRQGELYDRMFESDTELAGLWAKREKAVLALPRSIRPADSSREAAEAASFCRAALKIVPSRAINIRHNLGGVPRGVAVSELIWEKIERGSLAGAWLPVDVIDRPMWRFSFHAETRQLHLRRRAGIPVPAPPFKFQRLTHGTKDTPWGAPLFDQVYWFSFIKKHALKYWAVFVEKFASPTVVGKYKRRPGNSSDAVQYNHEQQAALLRVLDSIRTGRAIAVPDDVVIDFMEATRGGDSTYSGFTALLGRCQALIVLGEVDTSGMAKGPGSFAKSKVSNEVRLETVQDDAHMLGSFESDTLLRWITTVNFGPDFPSPKLVYDAMDAADREQRLQGIEAARKAGVLVPLAYARMTWQIPEPMEGEEVLEPPSSPAAEPSPAPAPGAPASLANSEHLVLLAADLGAAVEERDAEYAAVVESFLPDGLAYYEDHRGRVAGGWEDRLSPTFLQRLVIRPLEFAESLQTVTIHGMGLGMLHVRQDLEIRAAGEPGLHLALPPGADQARTPATALEFWARLLSIPKEFFRGLLDGFRKIATTVAGLTEGSTLLDVHRLLTRAVAEGMDRATFVTELDELYARHGLSPTSSHHAQLIYANNVRQAAHLTRYQQTVGNPAAHRLIPYLMWWTIADERVRQRPAHDHAVMHSYIAAIGHEIWQTWWPLAGHNCRCGIATISLPEARRRGLTGSEPSGPWPIAPGTGARALPDPGFRGAPNLQALTEDLHEKARALVETARGEASEDLMSALRALFEALGLAEALGG